MSPIKNCILNKETDNTPIWIMRQAGRYLPEFREIRKLNPDFIKLCLNEDITPEITLQPLKRYDLDAAIIFSDILMLPYGIGQKVEFQKGLGPILGDFNLDFIDKINEDVFTKKLDPIYKAIEIVSKDKIITNKDLICFVGAPWTLLVYMLNKQSPKKELNKKLVEDKVFVDELLLIIDKFLKIHIHNQIKSGATIIQIFDSWAGLVNKKDLEKFIYKPTISLIKFIKSLNIPVICFPRNVENYKEYVETVMPDAVNIDYNVDPQDILKNINIPVQGGLDPQILLTDKENLKKNALKYLEIFKDHPYIFNLGHGVLPATDPNMMDYLVKLVKDF
tara:strand:+ start:544 stop:1545 length:1002 start_codon:yes stop_codon:yes gene_type:complete